jgi:N-acetylneuraminate synthase
MKIAELFKLNREKPWRVSYPYIIAEAGVNHEGDINIAKRLIDEAKEGGADAIKFQTYKAEKLASKSSPYYWDIESETTENQFDLFRKYDKFWKNEYEQLKVYCDSVGIEFLSTPFDEESASFLDNLMEVFKISSSDITNKPFIDFVCNFNKPIILSTGASYYYEIQEAVQWILAHGNPLSLLHCVLNYPTRLDKTNLAVILRLKQIYPDILIGYSDHTSAENLSVIETAVLLGARIVEKHFTHDKSLPGNDHYHSMDKEDLKKLHQRLKQTFLTLGTWDKNDLSSEEPARRNARRSLIAKHDIHKGVKLTKKDLTWKRPAFGISPKHIDEVVGKTTARKIITDEIIYWNMLK